MKTFLRLSLFFLSFIALGQTPIAVFNFENKMSNTNNTATFTGIGANQAANTRFEADRAGRLNAALLCTGGGTSYEATIANLPSGNSPRTFSFWFKSDNIAANQHVFSYGAAATNQAQGYSIFSASAYDSYYYGFGNDISTTLVPSTYIQGAWNLYVLTFDGSEATVYRNGIILATANKSQWNTALSTLFRIGALVQGTPSLTGAIDDFKIYNVALSQTQVSAISSHRAANIAASANLARETNITSTSATLNYRVDAGNLPTNVTLNYGTTSGNLNNSVSITSGLLNSALTESSYTLGGLTVNTQYFYTITAENESGKTVLTEKMFSTPAPFSTVGLIAYFPFENDFLSTIGSHQLTAVGTAPTFVSGRIGQGVNFANDSLLGNSTGLVNNSTINSALSGSEYTVAFWADNNFTPLTLDLSQFPTLAELFGSSYIRHRFRNDQIQRGYASSATNFIASNPISQGPNISQGMNHIALVHKSGTATNRLDCALYINGQLISTISTDADVPELHRFNTKLFIGTGGSSIGNEDSNKRYKGIIDELYIYNRAIPAGEVLALMNNSNQTLGKKDFQTNNFAFSIYPNPANKILNVDTAQEIKSVEIYSLQGQKVLSASTKEINISGLSNGIYIVQVEDKNSSTAIKKLIVE